MKKIFEKLTRFWKKNSTVIIGIVLLLLLLLAFTLGRLSKPTPSTPPGPSPKVEDKIETPTPSAEEKEPESTPKAEEPESKGPTKGQINHRGIVSHVIDGDTIELEGGERVRYLGINTPEKGRPFSTEATEANKKLVAGKEVELELDVQTKDQYGRTLAYVWVGETMVNLKLIRLGYANAYTVPPNVKYKDQLLAAEREAREAERGLWAPTLGISEAAIRIVNINADAPGNDNHNKNGEWVEIKNTGSSTVNMTSWTLKDEANHIYTFSDFSLAPSASVFIYSGAGTDTNTKLYWNSPRYAVWNNTGDTAFLRDASGNLVDSYKY